MDALWKAIVLECWFAEDGQGKSREQWWSENEGLAGIVWARVECGWPRPWEW